MTNREQEATKAPEGLEPRRRTPFNPLHDTALLYTDASVKDVEGGSRVGQGIVGRIGGRTVALGIGSSRGGTTSTHAEAETLVLAIRTCIERRPTIRIIDVLTDDRTLATMTTLGALHPWMQPYMAEIRDITAGIQPIVRVAHVKGHSLRGPHGMGNAFAHHLAMLGRIGDDVRIDLQHSRSWQATLKSHDRRMDPVPLPWIVDTSSAARYLGLPRETVLRLLAAGHLIWDHERQGIRRPSIEHVRKEIERMTGTPETEEA